MTKKEREQFRANAALTFAQTLLSMPQAEIDNIDYEDEGGLLVRSKTRGFNISKTATKMADKLVEALGS